MRTTPEQITTLGRNEVFVFGANTAGRHGAGAARQAAQSFGAKYGVGEGLTGQCYAFPTLNGDLSKRTVDELKVSADKLREYARLCPALTFLVTKVGCGLAGFVESDMAALFVDMPENVILPEGWACNTSQSVA